MRSGRGSLGGSGRVLGSLGTVLVLATGLAVVLAPGAGAAACDPGLVTITWIGGGGDGDWHSSRNWEDTASVNRVPGAGDHVCVPDQTPDLTLAYTDGSFTTIASIESHEEIRLAAGSVELADGAVSSVLEAFDLAGGFVSGDGNLSVTGPMSWSSGGLFGPGGISVAQTATADLIGPDDKILFRDLTNDGTIDWADGDIFGGGDVLLDNLGTLAITHPGDQVFAIDIEGGPASVSNAGLVEKTGAGKTTMFASFENPGTMAVEDGRLALSGGFANFDGAALDGGRYEVSGVLEFTGAHVVTHAAATVLSGPSARFEDEEGLDGLRDLAANAATGDLTVTDGATVSSGSGISNLGLVTIGPDATLAAGGTYRQEAGATLPADATSVLSAGGAGVEVVGGILAGVGTVDGPIDNAATVSPGLSPGVLTGTESYDGGAGGTFPVEIAGTAPGSGHDRLTLFGPAVLGGTLAVETDPGFTPVVGDRFTILTAASVSGVFDAVTGTDLGGGLRYEVEYGATDATLVVTEPVVTLPEVSIGDAAPLFEGDGGTRDAVFPVTLDRSSEAEVTVGYGTEGGTATSPSDFVAETGTVTFPPGVTSQSVRIAVKGDTLEIGRAHV